MTAARETQLTHGPGGRILTNCNVWSPDGQWVVYDTRSDPAGDRFEGSRIEMVNTFSSEVRVLYESRNGAHCGAATWHPSEPKIVFILGPEFPTADWSYGPSHRQGVIVDVRNPGIAVPMDACDLVPPFTPGALSGGTHLHVWHPLGDWISFTYEDALVNAGRCIGVSIPDRPVIVLKSHPRNHDGSHFSVLVTVTGEGLLRACEEAWVGSSRSLAFQGEIEPGYREVFIAEVPDDPVTYATAIRRLTDTTAHRYPGIGGPRHWLHSSPNGSQIGFLKRDDAGIAQFWTVSPLSGEPKQITQGQHPVASAFTWHPDGKHVAFVLNNTVCLCDVETGEEKDLTDPQDDPIRPEACVVSPNGNRVAFVRQRGGANQICVFEVGGPGFEPGT